jgi:hypothetical protein
MVPDNIPGVFLLTKDVKRPWKILGTIPT